MAPFIFWQLVLQAMTSFHFPISMLSISKVVVIIIIIIILPPFVINVEFTFVSKKSRCPPPGTSRSLVRWSDGEVSHLNGEIMQLREGLTNELQDWSQQKKGDIFGDILRKVDVYLPVLSEVIYNSYKWPYKWVSGVLTLLIGMIGVIYNLTYN